MADITGTGANDVLVGTNDDDTLNGLVGADKMAGGDGNDVYFVDQAGDVVTELADKGFVDRIVTTVSTTLAANAEFLELVGGALNGIGNKQENVLLGNSFDNTLDGGDGHDLLSGGLGKDTLIGGKGDDYLTDSSGQNLLQGGAGNDTLTGFGADNVMEGGAGDDRYYVDSASDQVVEQAGQGTDAVFTHISFDLSTKGAQVEELYLNGSGNQDGTGNELANYIAGNDYDNKIDGRGGNDTLFGGGGEDTLIGGDGDDYLDGQDGVDTLNGGKGNDTYYLGNDGAIIDESGVDEVVREGTLEMGELGAYDENMVFTPAAIERLTLVGTGDYDGGGNAHDNTIAGNSGNNELRGNEGNDTLLGGGGDDTLKGGAGNDAMIGGKGDDTYWIDSKTEVVTENAGEGYDTVVAGISHILGANLESLELLDGNIDGTGNALANYLGGGSGNNQLDGAAGDDGIEGGDGNDTLLGAAGDDELYGGDGNDSIRGGDGNDYLQGNTGNDTLLGGDGNDYIDGYAGDDEMSGGKGNDDYYVDSLGDVVSEQANEGIDTVHAIVNYTLGGNIENLSLSNNGGTVDGEGNALNNAIYGGSGKNVLQGHDGNDTLTGGDGDDTLKGGAGNDTLNGGIGINRLEGGVGNDTYLLDLGTNLVVENADEGIDTVINDENTNLALGDLVNIENLVLNGNAAAEGRGNGFSNVITGNDNDNDLFGALGDDTLSGGAGADWLFGGGGKDKMSGGVGDDHYVVDDLGDKVEEKAGEGFDTIRSILSTYVLAANIENLEFDTAPGVNGTGNALANNIYGSAGNDVLDGKAGDDYVYGYEGNDTLTGGDGGDLLYGGDGNDVMTGGKGNDIYYIDNKDDKITELSGQGIDLIFSDISLNLSDKAFLNIENLALQGVGNLTAGGNALANAITGNSGDNIISGGAGNDRLDGAAGNDSLDGLFGDDFLLGGAGNDELLGFDGRDTLFGGDNDDALNGQAGDDVLDGGGGFNYLKGGLGNDIYIVSGGTDTIEENDKAGIDEVRADKTWSLALLASVENLTLTGSDSINGTGNALANVIKGNDAGNSLRGGDGNDTLFGGAGEDSLYGEAGNDKMIGGADNDFYYVDSAKDTVVESKNQGYDTVHTVIDYKLAANVEELLIEGTGDTKGTGNALNNLIDGNDGKNKLDGAAGNDTLYGSGGDDSLIGGAGRDELAGGTGNDTMTGGAGNDTYYVDDDGDKVKELAGQGIDTILTSRSFDLSLDGANVENLKAYNPKNYTLIGNSLNNTIEAAESGDDSLDGRAGNDTLIGGAGQDTLNGGAGNDRLLGGDGDDWLEGDDGNDTLVGGAGNDVMIGGAGNDTYEYTDGSDEFGELEGEGIDTVVTNKNYILGSYLENVILIGTGNYNATGNELANVITGNEGNNQLSGLGGNDLLIAGIGDDTLIGAAGKDTLRGGQGSDFYYVEDLGDVVIENKGEGDLDGILTTLTSYTLGKNVELLGFEVGTNAVVGNGNELDNFIYGGGGNDKLDGKAGNDFIDGESGDDSLTGGDGNDQFNGATGNDTLNGGAGSDTLDGGSGKDLMIGGAGNDTYLVDDAGDTVQEAANGGIDTISTKITLDLGATIENAYAEIGGLKIGGNGLNNVIGGSTGADTLQGKDGADVLTGHGDADVLEGGAGDDVIEGGLGADKLDGGSGSDLFRYRLESTADLNNLGGDLITGFEAGKDKIDLYDLFVDFDIEVDDVLGEGVLRLEVSNGDTLLQFDKDGGADSFVTLATLQGVTNVTLADLIYPSSSIE